MLRPERYDFLAEQAETQVVSKRRTLPHGEHAGLRARVVHHVGDIADGEDVRRRQRLQRVVDLDEAPLVNFHTAAARPIGGPRGRDPQHFVESERLSVGEADQIPRPAVGVLTVGAARGFAVGARCLLDAIHRHHPATGEHVDVAFGKHAAELGAHAVVMRRQYLLGHGGEGVRQAVGPLMSFLQKVLQAVLDGEQDFDPAGTTTDDPDADIFATLALSTRFRSFSQRRQKPAIGFTGTTDSAAPGTRKPGVEPILIDTTS